MQIFGLTIARTETIHKELQSIYGGNTFRPLISEPFTGAWQRNKEEGIDSVLSYGPVFACQTLIASDIAKMGCLLVERDSNRIWKEIESNSPFWPVLRKPNGFQNRIQFFESWLLSKLSWGNTYVLKARDNRGVVVALYVLDPCRVKVLVSDSGEVFYECRKDCLSRQSGDNVIVPAREIIHDRFNCLFHPLVGLSPLFAATLPASQGLKIQRQSSKFWQNAARPSGILTAPTEVKQETADRIKSYWEANFSGDNTAKIAVLGDGMTYSPMTMTSVDAQLVEQLSMSAKAVASAYHVPAYKIGAAEPPSYNNIEALQQDYYGQCLQRHIEDIELCLDEGLGLTAVQGKTLGTMFDLDDLLRMDTKTLMETLDKGKNYLTPNEGRYRLNMSPADGGDSVYRQQQDFSLEALAKRDAQDDPFGGAQPVPAAPPEDQQAAFVAEYIKLLPEALDAA